MISLQRLISNRTFKLLQGGALSQLILIFSSLLIARLYTPNDLTAALIFSSYTAIINSFSTLNLENCICLPKSQLKASELWILGIFICFLVSCLVFLILTCLEFFSYGLFSDSSFYFIFLIPLGVFLISSNKLTTYYALRLGLEDKISLSKLTQAFVGLLIIYMFQTFGALTLVLAQVISQSLGAFILIGSYKFRSTFKLRSIKPLSLIGTYRSHMFLGTPSSIINSFSLQIPILILTRLLSSFDAGYFALAQKIIMVPVALFNLSLTQGFYNRCCELKRNGLNLRQYINKFFRILLVSSATVVTSILLLSGSFISVVYTNVWLPANEIVRMLLPLLFFQLVISPISSIFIVNSAIKQEFIAQLIFFVVRVLPLALLAQVSFLSDLSLHVYVYSSVCAYIVYSFFLVMQYNKIKHCKN